MPSRYMRLPYRFGVGVLLMGPGGRICVERTPADCGLAASLGSWQMPECGIAAHEPPREAGLRLLREGLGFGSAQVLAEAPGWFAYELPADMLGVALGGRYCGQKQKWIAARIEEPGRVPSTVRTWVPAGAVPRLAPVLKREIYEDVLATFAPLLSRPAAEPVHGTQPARPQKAAALPWFVTLFG